VKGLISVRWVDEGEQTLTQTGVTRERMSEVSRDASIFVQKPLLSTLPPLSGWRHSPYGFFQKLRRRIQDSSQRCVLERGQSVVSGGKNL